MFRNDISKVSNTLSKQNLINLSVDSQTIPQLGVTAFPRHRKRRDEEQIMTKQTPHMKPPTHKQRRTATEEELSWRRHTFPPPHPPPPPPPPPTGLPQKVYLNCDTAWLIPKCMGTHIWPCHENVAGHPGIIIWIILVDLESPMLYTSKLSLLWRRRFSAVFLYHIWTWRPSCSIVWNHLNKLSIPLRQKATVKSSDFPASILYKSTAGRYRPVSYPDEPITARYRFIKNAYWELVKRFQGRRLLKKMQFYTCI